MFTQLILISLLNVQPWVPVYGVVWFLFSDYLPRAATGIALCFLMQTDRVETSRTDRPRTDRLRTDGQLRSESRDPESADAPLSADESGVTSRADLAHKHKHKQLHFEDKEESRQDAELTNYRISSSSNEVGIGHEDVSHS